MSDNREEIMRVMRAYDVPDDVIAGAWGISRQRVHRILGARPRPKREDLDTVGSNDATARLPAALRAWRKRHELSQPAAARALGVDVATIVRWETRAACGIPSVVLKLLELMP